MIKLFPEHIINAVCDGLLYSLGLGILLAAVTGIIVLSTRKASARVRHNLLVSALVVFAGAVFVSFITQLLQIQPSPASYTTLADNVPFADLTETVSAPATDYIRIIYFFREYADVIVLLWALIVVLKAFQLMTGLQSLSILKRKEISTVGDEWEERVRLLAKQLGIQRVVRIAASGIAKVPMVIGHLKPIILIPAGLITSLSPASIEAILVHELAHIRRRDWLVNLLLSSLEVIFFFNPAVLWISSLIRTERENCCDDIAIAHTGSKISYIDTLVACQQYQLSVSSYTLAFSGPKKPLLARIKRMISDKNSSLNRAERGIMAVTLLVALIGIAAFTATGKKKEITPTSLLAPIQKDGLYGGTTTRSQYAADSMISIDDSLHSLTNRVRPFIIPSYNFPPDPIQPIIYKSFEVDDHTDVTIPNEGVLTRLVKLDSILYQVNSQGGKISSLQVDGNTVEAAKYAVYLDKISTLTSNTRSYTLPDINTQYKPYTQECKPYDDGSNLDKLVAALIAANVIHHKEELHSFKLSDTEFIMNDIKMPDDIYLPLRNAFVKAPVNGKKGSWAWMYNYKTT